MTSKSTPHDSTNNAPVQRRADSEPLEIVILGLSLSSSWGNGHATTYRSLVKGLFQEGHRVTFLERDVEWYASNRDLTHSPHSQLIFYNSPKELRNYYGSQIRDADLVVVGSYLQDGVEIGKWITKECRGVTAFYDIDTPVTLSKLERGDLGQGDEAYLSRDLIPRYDLYLSFSGGNILKRLENDYGAARARPLYCSVDPNLYHPTDSSPLWDMGYLGTYSLDRQPALEQLLLQPAADMPEGSFVVAGPQYPEETQWPENVKRIEHLPPRDHCTFYNEQRFTLNVTRSAMIDAGFSPSVRLFEAAACGTPVISDAWEGLETFFEPGREILIANSDEEVRSFLTNLSEEERQEIGRRAREKVLKEHSSRTRARELANYAYELEKMTAKS